MEAREVRKEGTRESTSEKKYAERFLGHVAVKWDALRWNLEDAKS